MRSSRQTFRLLVTAAVALALVGVRPWMRPAAAATTSSYAQTLRHLTGGAVAFAGWQLTNGSIVAVKISQQTYDVWTQAGAIGDAPGRPDPAAVFLLAAGGIPALDTVDGWPAIGDSWEETDPDTKLTVLHVATGTTPNWGYSSYAASDPGTGSISAISGFAARSDRNTLTLPSGSYTLTDVIAPTPQKVQLALGMYVPKKTTVADVDGGVLSVPTGWAKSTVQPITGTIVNHKSVTFDRATEGDTLVGSTASSVTISHLVASQSNLYLAGVSSHRGGQNLSTVTYNAVGLTSRIDTGSSVSARAEYWDLVAPSTGTNNAVFSYSAATSAVAGVISAYGVDQTTPRTGTGSSLKATTAGTENATASASSTANDLVVSNICLDVFRTGASTGMTDTPDATWTQGWSADMWTSGTNMRAGIGMYIAGAAGTVTRTDSVTSVATQAYAMTITSVAAAAASTPGCKNGLLMFGAGCDSATSIVRAWWSRAVHGP